MPFKEGIGVWSAAALQDYKGITPLGYAIGANRIAIVKLLLDSVRDLQLQRQIRKVQSSSLVVGLIF